MLTQISDFQISDFCCLVSFLLLLPSFLFRPACSVEAKTESLLFVSLCTFSVEGHLIAAFPVSQDTL